jgi:hypothetical protein
VDTQEPVSARHKDNPRLLGVGGKSQIRNFKWATALELLLACRSGAEDVLFAYPAMGANARRVREIADQFPETRISLLVENRQQVGQWRDSRIGVFLGHPTKANGSW